MESVIGTVLLRQVAESLIKMADEIDAPIDTNQVLLQEVVDLRNELTACRAAHDADQEQIAAYIRENARNDDELTWIEQYIEDLRGRYGMPDGKHYETVLLNLQNFVANLEELTVEYVARNRHLCAEVNRLESAPKAIIQEGCKVHGVLPGYANIYGQVRCQFWSAPKCK